MEPTTRSGPRHPWSFKGLMIGAWRSLISLFVVENTWDRREVDKLHTRWESEDAGKAGKPPAGP